VRASEKRWKGLKSFGFSVNYLSNLQHHSIKWFILLLVIASVPIAIRTTTLSYFLPLLQMLFIDLRCDSDLVLFGSSSPTGRKDITNNPLAI